MYPPYSRAPIPLGPASVGAAAAPAAPLEAELAGLSPAEAQAVGRPAAGPGCGDVVVTVPKNLWRGWIAEGELAGSDAGGIYEEYHYLIGRRPPQLEPGARVYIVAFGRLRGYAPLVRVAQWDEKRWSLVRRGGAQAVTIEDEIPGFRGLRWRWWPREAERPFPDWQRAGIPGR